MSNKPEKHLFIREYIPPIEEPPEPFIDITDKTWHEGCFYDMEKQICFFVFREPSWIHMTKDKYYELEFEDYNDDDMYIYKLYARLENNLVLIAEDYGNGYCKTEEKYLGENWKKISVNDWLKENYPSAIPD